MTKRSAATTAPVDLIPFTVAAEIAGRKRQNLHQLRAAGKLDAVRVGVQWFTTRAEAERIARMPKSKGGRPRQNKSKISKKTIDTEQG